MFRKHYRELAEILESKDHNPFCSLAIADMLEENFKNFDREKFLVACGFDKGYTYDEYLTAWLEDRESMSIFK